MAEFTNNQVEFKVLEANPDPQKIAQVTNQLTYREGTLPIHLKIEKLIRPLHRRRATLAKNERKAKHYVRTHLDAAEQAPYVQQFGAILLAHEIQLRSSPELTEALNKGLSIAEIMMLFGQPYRLTGVIAYVYPPTDILKSDVPDFVSGATPLLSNLDVQIDFPSREGTLTPLCRGTITGFTPSYDVALTTMNNAGGNPIIYERTARIVQMAE